MQCDATWLLRRFGLSVRCQKGVKCVACLLASLRECASPLSYLFEPAVLTFVAPFRNWASKTDQGND